MFGNIALDVFIGLICIYLLYSLLASILMEAVAKYLGLRPRITLKGIYKLLDDSEYTEHAGIRRFFTSIDIEHFFDPLKGRPFTALFYAHPNIKNLGKNNFNRKPSSITPEMFSETLIQILRGDEFIGQQNQIDLIKSNIKIEEVGCGKNGCIIKKVVSLKTPLYYQHSPYKPVEKEHEEDNRIKFSFQTYYQISQLLYNSHSDIDWFRKGLITWFNEMMDRAEGWYIKQTRTILFIIGFIIAVSFNVDTIAISKKLANDKTARDKMIEFATKVSNDNKVKFDSSDAALNGAFKKSFESITESQKILGQTSNFHPFTLSFWKDELWKGLSGWLITAFALSLGASFWFDLLGKIMCIRQGGNNSSTDAQKKVDKTLTNPTKEPVG